MFGRGCHTGTACGDGWNFRSVCQQAHKQKDGTVNKIFVDMLGLSCIFPVPEIKNTADFYVSKLGFKAIEYLDCTEKHICLYRDMVEIILLQANRDKILPNRFL